ncbi:hypothetical protein V8J88_17190 [Massilia sp. W12]|uniref:hypothetical protein n=1 Tax=Massilia sp. W12 TaxID=3126507 RepID=UPI0030D26812
MISEQVSPILLKKAKIHDSEKFLMASSFPQSPPALDFPTSKSAVFLVFRARKPAQGRTVVCMEQNNAHIPTTDFEIARVLGQPWLRPVATI